VDGDLGGGAEMVGETFGLVEFTLAELRGIERDGHDVLPFVTAEVRFGGVNEKAGEEGFEPKSAVVFVFVDEVEHAVAKDNNGASVAKMKLVIAAIGAFEDRRDCAFKGKSATLAKGRCYVVDVVAADIANVAFVGSGARVAAELAGLGIDEREGGV